MTVNELQEQLIKEIECITKGLSLVNTKGEPADMQGYPQAIPIFPAFQNVWEDDHAEEQLTQSEEELFPYFVVRTDTVDYQVEDKDGSGNRVRVLIAFAVVDHDPKLKGYFTLMAAIERGAERFQKNQALGPVWCSRKMSIANQEDDTFPYFFAGLEMLWYMPEIEQEEMW